MYDIEFSAPQQAICRAKCRRCHPPAMSLPFVTDRLEFVRWIIKLRIFIHNIWRWDWLLNHPESYGLQVAIHITVLFGIVGFFVNSWRKVVWSITFLGAVVIGVMQMLGGPENQ